jgi:hypothetical protein
VAIGTIRKNVEHQEISWFEITSPQGDIQSIEGPEKNDKLYPGEEDTDSSVILDVNKKASGIPALYLKQHKSVEGVIAASLRSPPDEKGINSVVPDRFSGSTGWRLC